MLAQPATLIPDQYGGGKSDTWFSIIADTDKGAAQLFKVATQRLLDINNWSSLCGISSAAFRLTDAKGLEVDRLIETGDHFRIDIPGPGTIGGQGYDWVEIEKIETRVNACAESEWMAVTVRPSPNPLNNDVDTAHFFSSDATTTFIVQRDKKRVTAEVHGRNEQPNNQTENSVDNIRNTIVGTTALTGFSDNQWKQLVKGILS